MNPTRVTVAFDETTAKLLDKFCSETKLSQSEIMRRALKGYDQNRQLEDPAIAKRVQLYMELLMKGEHIILDIDHWLIFLQLIDSSPEKERFWGKHREVARAHAEQLKTTTSSGEELLMRLLDSRKMGKEILRLYCCPSIRRILSEFFLRSIFQL
jgi:hypothetical protein